MKTVLTEKQKAFLDALYDEAGGDVRKAMKIAGYSASTPMAVIVESLADEIVERGRRFLAVNVPKAAFGMINIVDDPAQLGGERKLAAIKEVMDRAGLAKRDKLEVSAEGISGVFILPAKNST